MKLKEIYKKNLDNYSDIQEHLGLLRGLAEHCRVVVEFGFRTGVSTSALLMGGAKVFSYDIADCAHAKSQFAKAAGSKFEFHQASSREADIPACDMLFIDSRHDYVVFREELEKHHAKVKRWIVCHDVETFGDAGQTAGDPGLRKAIDEFLEGHKEWRIMLYLKNNNGLLVMERLRG